MFGFDLMVDDALKVWLIECNSSPAVAEELNQKLAEDLVAREIDPYFGIDHGGSEPSSNGWKEIFKP